MSILSIRWLCWKCPVYPIGRYRYLRGNGILSPPNQSINLTDQNVTTTSCCCMPWGINNVSKLFKVNNKDTWKLRNLFNIKSRDTRKMCETCVQVTLKTLEHCIISSQWTIKNVEQYPSRNYYMFKVNDRNTRTRREICSKLTIKIPERSQWRRSGIFIVNFEHISHLVLLTLSR